MRLPRMIAVVFLSAGTPAFGQSLVEQPACAPGYICTPDQSLSGQYERDRAAQEAQEEQRRVEECEEEHRMMEGTWAGEAALADPGNPDAAAAAVDGGDMLGPCK